MRHSPHNEAVNVVVPVHVAKLEVSADATNISGIRERHGATKNRT